MNIFKYKDYRKFIAAYKKKNRLSWQALSDEVGIISNSYLIEINQGIKNLSRKYLWIMGTTMKLSTTEMLYFHLMLIHSDTKWPTEKKWASKQMKKIREEL